MQPVDMTTFLLRRLVFMALTVLGAVTVTFMLANLVPADPARAALGPDATEAQVANYRRERGLDQPLLVQYGRYVSAMLRADLGTSIVSRAPVAGDLGKFIPATVELLVPSLVISVVFGIVARMTRSSLLDVLSSNYVRTARSKCLRESVVLWKHALRNAAVPIVTVIGLRLGQMFSGAVLTEMVFAWPGVGRYAFTALKRLDFPVVMGFTVWATIMRQQLYTNALVRMHEDPPFIYLGNPENISATRASVHGFWITPILESYNFWQVHLD